MAKVLFSTEFILQNGNHVRGPITTEDDSTFVFHNELSSLDVNFTLQLIDGTWQHVAGIEGLILLPELTQTIGLQIEAYYSGNPIELE
jgi:hypothetical protein